MNNILNKEQQNLINNLLSQTETKVLETLSIIRDQGGIFAVETILNIFFKTESLFIKDNIYELFCDAKDKNLSNVILNNVAKYQNEPDFSKLISAFWQSGLHFDNIIVFLEIFNNTNSDNLLVEIFALIEENFNNQNQEIKDKCYSYIKAKLSNYHDFKRQLAEEILKL